jgi:hypothetical protein
VTDDEPRSIRDVNPDVPSWVEGIVRKMLSKAPSDRYASADVVAELLEDCVAHVQQPAANPLPEGLGVVLATDQSRRRARWLVACGVVVMSTMATVTMWPAPDVVPGVSEPV